jgi:UDP-N-acetylglucosamine--N-acetylmuramyl-(pentapeptide) pyrophosphoryl-undecaprenol N-acetylglucosamine transferase
MEKNYTVVTCGTAGHVLPALAVTRDFLKKNKKINLIIDNNTYKKYENTLKKEEFKQLNIIITMPFHINYKFIYIIIKNILITYKTIKNSSVILFFVAGVQVPTLFTCLLFNRNFILHEQDSVLNKTNSIFGIFAKKIFTSFRDCKINYIGKNIIKNKMIWTGCPVNINDQITNLNKSKKKIITIFAGTNGSEFMDKILINELIKIKNIQDYYIYHNCRKENIDFVKNFYKNNNIEAEVESYFSNFEFLYKYSHLLITRGGASTISYLNYFEKNCILIPWSKSSQNHQYFNCLNIQNVGGALMVEEKHFHQLSSIINKALNDPQEIGINIKKIFKTVNIQEYLCFLKSSI